MCLDASKGLVTDGLGFFETESFYQNYSDLLGYVRPLFLMGEKVFMDPDVVNFI